MYVVLLHYKHKIRISKHLYNPVAGRIFAKGLSLVASASTYDSTCSIITIVCLRAVCACARQCVCHGACTSGCASVCLGSCACACVCLCVCACPFQCSRGDSVLLAYYKHIDERRRPAERKFQSTSHPRSGCSCDHQALGVNQIDAVQ